MIKPSNLLVGIQIDLCINHWLAGFIGSVDFKQSAAMYWNTLLGPNGSSPLAKKDPVMMEQAFAEV